MEPTIFAVCWQDHLVGALHIKKESAADAIASQQSIAIRGLGKVSHVRAVELTPDNRLIDLAPTLNSDLPAVTPVTEIDDGMGGTYRPGVILAARGV